MKIDEIKFYKIYLQSGYKSVTIVTIKDSMNFVMYVFFIYYRQSKEDLRAKQLNIKTRKNKRNEGKKKMKTILQNPHKAVAKIVRTTLIIVTIMSLSFRAEAVNFDNTGDNTLFGGIQTMLYTNEERKLGINGISPYVIYEGDELPDLLENIMIGYKNDYNFVDTGVTSMGIEDYKLSQKDYTIEVETVNDIDTNVIGQNAIVYRLVNNGGNIVYEETTSLTIKPNLEKHISGIDDLVFKESTVYNLEQNMVIDEYIKEVQVDDGNVDYDTPGKYQAIFTLVGQDDEIVTIDRVVTINPHIYGIHDNYELVGNNLQEQVWNFLIDHGLTKVQAAGIMGNISAECGWRADAVETGNNIGYGLIQWSFGRRSQMEHYAYAMGTTPSDVKTQLTFLMMELSSNAEDRQGYCNWQFSGDYYTVFVNGNTPEDTARAFCNGFERPAEFISYGSFRQTEARRFYDMYA